MIDSPHTEHDDGLQRNVEFLQSIEKSLRNWRALVVWALIGAALGAVIGFSTPKTYTSSVLVAPEITTRSNLGSLSSLASLAGISSVSMTMTDAMHPNLFPELIQSSNFCVRLFDMPVTVADKDSTVHTDLYNYITTYNKTPWWGAVKALPGKAVDAVKGWLASGEDADDAEGYSVLDTLRLTKQQESVVKFLNENIQSSVDKKSYALSISVKMQDPVIAGQLANRVAEQLKEFVLKYRSEKAGDNVEYLEKIHEQSKADYLSALRRYTAYLDSHQGVVSNSALAVQQQLRNEFELQLQIYGQSAQKLLTARAKAQEEAPVIAIIQPGVSPNTGEPSVARLIILCCLLGAVLRFAWVVFGFDYLFGRLFEGQKKS